MNLVLDDAEEVYIEKSGKETKARQDLGKWLVSLRGVGGGERRGKRSGGGCWVGVLVIIGKGKCGKMDDGGGREGCGARVDWRLG
jgi:hypothetical protein